MELCSENHDEIVYEGRNCPACEIRIELEDQLKEVRAEAKQDLENALEDAQKELERVQEELNDYLEIANKAW